MDDEGMNSIFEHLEWCMCISETEIKPDIKRLLKQTSRQISHQWLVFLKKVIRWYMNLNCFFRMLI